MHLLEAVAAEIDAAAGLGRAHAVRVDITNRADCERLLMAQLKLSKDEAEATYKLLLDPQIGYVRDAKLDPEGFKATLAGLSGDARADFVRLLSEGNEGLGAGSLPDTRRG